MRHLLIFLFLCLSLAACERFGLLTTPKKYPRTVQSALSVQAENTFWDILHRGDYNNIPNVIKLLTAAYLENPNDPKLAAHLGFTHIWKITERARDKSNPPTIVDEIILARKYFNDAVELDPRDARYQGFLGDSLLIEGKIFHDKRQEMSGFFQLERSISMWPEFNYFTAGYPLSILEPHNRHFQDALDWQWNTLTLCAETQIDKNNPDYSPYMHLETHAGPKRACWNSWIAPHNFEGFFLNMGDMLVKSGDWQTGIKIYNNAKLSKTYNTWPYRAMLENRIQHAQENVAVFQKQSGLSASSANVLFNSGYGCVVCHQAG